MKKRIIVISIIIIFLVLIGVGFFIWNNKYKEAVSFCQNDCEYFEYSYSWRFRSGGDIVWSMSFYDTEKECVNHCIDFNYFLGAFKR